uniref:Uncharacterized protein n=1 Tax=Octopus bimaculoides TaxID=37653 RepID=A0A0L8I8J5_OCTBM
MKCFRRLLRISYRDCVTNKEVKRRIRQAIGPYEELLATVKKHKLRWSGHITHLSGMPERILQGTVKGGRCRGRQRKRWENNICEWTDLKITDTV